MLPHVNNIPFLQTGATKPFIEMPLPTVSKHSVHQMCVGPLQETSELLTKAV